MVNDLIVYNGLYGDQSARPMLDFIHAEPLEARSKTYNWEIKEHIHTELAQLFIIQSGNGALNSDKIQWQFNGPSIIFIPANTLHGFVFNNKIIGDVLTFDESLLTNLLKNQQNVFIELQKLHCIPMQSGGQLFQNIDSLVRIMSSELQTDGLERKSFLNSLFLSVFLLIYRSCKNQISTINPVDNKLLSYFQRFQQGVKGSFNHSKTISNYAKELGITTMHLNRVCKTVVGKSPIQIVHEYMITEAKKYLLHTNYSVSEISYFLNFNDPAYFTRLFKQKVGVSPSDFRKG